MGAVPGGGRSANLPCADGSRGSHRTSLRSKSHLWASAIPRSRTTNRRPTGCWGLTYRGKRIPFKARRVRRRWQPRGLCQRGIPSLTRWTSILFRRDRPDDDGPDLGREVRAGIGRLDGDATTAADRRRPICARHRRLEPVSRILVGTASWTEPTLIKQGDFYNPKQRMSAEERLRFYTSRFPVVEVDSTYYFPPSGEELRPVDRTHAEGLRLQHQGVLAADQPPHEARLAVQGRGRRRPSEGARGQAQRLPREDA